MSMTEHPITPPPDVVQKLWDSAGTWMDKITAAYQAGADQELEACLTYVGNNGLSITRMRAARRPKPPSLKEEALAALERYQAEEWCEEMTFDSSIIRRALEALPE